MNAVHDALVRAINEYGDTLTIELTKQTECASQKIIGTGHLVYGRTFDGGPLCCVFPTKNAARVAIAKAQGGAS